MEKSKIFLIIGAIIIVSALVIKIATPTNRWVCEHGVWVAQGNPQEAKPSDVCINDLSMDEEIQALEDMLGDNNFISTEIEETKELKEKNISPIINDEANEEKVILISPQINGIVHNQDIIIGRAPNDWFFENSLPVDIININGDLLFTGFVESQDEWESDEWTLFRGTLNFNISTSTAAELVFKKSNSSLSEYEEQVSYPVKLEP